MISGEYWKLQDDAAIAKIDAAAVQLLSEGGVRVEHDEMLDILEGAGCRSTARAGGATCRRD